MDILIGIFWVVLILWFSFALLDSVCKNEIKKQKLINEKIEFEVLKLKQESS